MKRRRTFEFYSGLSYDMNCPVKPHQKPNWNILDQLEALQQMFWDSQITKNYSTPIFK